MPEYRNDTQNPIPVETTDGDIVTLLFGQSAQTYRFYPDSGLTKVSDDPRYNPVTAAEVDITENDQEVTVDGETSTIIAINDNSDVDVSMYWGTKANTPPTTIPKGGTVRIFSGVKGYTDKLILSFSDGSLTSGDCRIIQERT